ncbi:amidase [Haloactinopolyspora alba]|nr:amidase [Haloactinopolyspora alba]
MIGNATWLVRLDTNSTGQGPRLAVKDCIDVAGTVTTVGSRAVAAGRTEALVDAPVVENARNQGARIVGKTNLVELCRHADGYNQWTGTPLNPLDQERITGGSSSGSAVAVALDETDVAYGTDTGGSVRVPAACCGIAGLKTTTGRLPTHGVFEFSRTLDTVGPLAREVAGLVTGMRLMEPGFEPAVGGSEPVTAARLRFDRIESAVDEAVDRAVAAAGLRVTDVTIPDWETWIDAANDIMMAEGYAAHRYLMTRPDLLEQRHIDGIEKGGAMTAPHIVACRRVQNAARLQLRALLERYDVLVLPTLLTEPPRVGEPAWTTYLTVPVNLAGLPAVSLPVPRPDRALPASIQVVGGWYEEERLLAVAEAVEAGCR